MRKYLQVGWLLTYDEGLISWVGIGDGLIASHETYMIRGSCGSKCPYHAHTPQFHSWLEKSLPRSLLRFRPLSTDGHVFFSSTGVCHVQIRRRRCANQHHNSMCRKRCRRPVAGSVTTSNQFLPNHIESRWRRKAKKKWYKKTIEKRQKLHSWVGFGAMKGFFANFLSHYRSKERASTDS